MIAPSRPQAWKKKQKKAKADWQATNAGAGGGGGGGGGGGDLMAQLQTRTSRRSSGGQPTAAPVAAKTNAGISMALILDDIPPAYADLWLSAQNL